MATYKESLEIAIIKTLKDTLVLIQKLSGTVGGKNTSMPLFANKNAKVQTQKKVLASFSKNSRSKLGCMLYLYCLRDNCVSVSELYNRHGSHECDDFR